MYFKNHLDLILDQSVFAVRLGNVYFFQGKLIFETSQEVGKLVLIIRYITLFVWGIKRMTTSTLSMLSLRYQLTFEIISSTEDLNVVEGKERH